MLLHVRYWWDQTWNKTTEGSLGTLRIQGYDTDDNWRSPPDSVCCETKPQAIWWSSCSSLCYVYHLNDEKLLTQHLAACDWRRFWCQFPSCYSWSTSLSGTHSNSIPSAHSRNEIFRFPIRRKRTNALAYSDCSPHVNALHNGTLGPHINQPCSFTETSRQTYSFFNCPWYGGWHQRKSRASVPLCCTDPSERLMRLGTVYNRCSELCQKPSSPTRPTRHQYKTLPFKAWVAHSLDLDELWVSDA